jgi:3-dehydroquinate synthase
MHQTIEQRFSIRYSFPVVFCRDIFQPGNRVLADILAKAGPRRHRLIAFIDSGVLSDSPDLEQRLEEYARSHCSIMELVAPPVAVIGGEACKNDPAILRRLQTFIEHHHLCRQSFVLAIGGGAVLDVVGFAAATAHRGLRLIRIPTTVLGQNDAGVGVKNSVNAFGRKNFLGTFAPPWAVINDFAFLDSLKPRDLRAGIVEAVKVALIKDRAFFDYLYGQRHKLAEFFGECMEKMIGRCAELHMEHIGTQGDPFEFGSSRPLDFGHWTAHKLEEITGGALNHGEAVAVGIALDTLYSREVGMLRQPGAVEAVFTTLEDLGLELYHPALQQLDILAALGEFQEHLGGELTITLLTGLGAKKEVHSIDVKLMRRCIDLLAERHLHILAVGPDEVRAEQEVAAGRPARLVRASVAIIGGAGRY